VFPLDLESRAPAGFGRKWEIICNEARKKSSIALRFREKIPKSGLRRTPIPDPWHLRGNPTLFLLSSVLPRPEIFFPCANFQRPANPEQISAYQRKSAAIFFCLSPWCAFGCGAASPRRRGELRHPAL
jgi:hypothetical protein